MLKLNKVYLGDCLEVMKSIDDESIDLILCDLPYGTTNCKWDSIIDLDKLWIQYKRIIKPSGAIVLTAQTPFDKVLGASNLKMLRYEWIWEKTKATGHLNAKKMPMKAHENVLVFYKKLPTYNPQKTTGHKPVNSYTKSIKNGTADGDVYGKTGVVSGGGNTDRHPRSVQVFKSDTQKSKLHSTQKPLVLGKYFIETYSNEGDVVLDNACGSGTFGLAAKELKRNFIMIDNDPESFMNANSRIM